jgi:hypothetical protein
LPASADQATGVCTENLVRLDLMAESPNVDRDGRIPPVHGEFVNPRKNGLARAG